LSQAVLKMPVNTVTGTLIFTRLGTINDICSVATMHVLTIQY